MDAIETALLILIPVALMMVPLLLLDAAFDLLYKKFPKFRAKIDRWYDSYYGKEK